METKRVFQYLSARRYLVDSLEAKRRADTSFSIRKWSKEMGMSSHALLVMVLQGKRSLTLKQVPFLAKGLRLTTQERMYFQCLIQYENARTDEERDLCRLWMSELNPGQLGAIREVDEFLMIAHWVHMAILTLAQTGPCANSPAQIHRRLGGKVPQSEIASAIARLVSLGLLKIEGTCLRATFAQITSKDDVANRGAREYHKQVAHLAADAIERVPLDRREFQSFAVGVPNAKIPLAKEMIRKFRAQFIQAMSEQPADEIFQMNINFFQLTECPSEIVPKVDEGAGTAKAGLETTH